VDEPELVSDLLLLEPLAGRAKTPEGFELISELLRLEPYARRVLAERYWLEDVLERKDEVMAFFDQGRGHATAQGAFRCEFDRFIALAGGAPRLPIRAEEINPQLNDRASVTPIDRHYIYHPAWAARVLAKTRPAKHVDISSIVSFATVVSAFLPVDFYDFRPAPVELDGLYTGAADLTQMPFASDSISSLSCMHVLEHIGLGRYGDPLDPDGDLKAIGELVRVLAPGGNLLVATPVGRSRVEFNAHRVYDHEAFASYFAPLELVEFALIRERGDGGLVVAPPAAVVRAESYGCGCFWFHKPKAAQHVPAEAAGVGALAV
jgi:SAM-dependent methyltransferase